MFTHGGDAANAHAIPRSPHELQSTERECGRQAAFTTAVCYRGLHCKGDTPTMTVHPRFVLPAPNQIGFAVRDLEAALTRYRQRYGLEPTLTETIELDGRNTYRYHGRPNACRLKIALFDQDGVQLELIQLLDGEHPVGDFVRQRGEGVNHLGFFVDDLDATVRSLIEQGARPVIEGHFRLTDGRAGAFVWLTDDDGGGAMLEISAFR